MRSSKLLGLLGWFAGLLFVALAFFLLGCILMLLLSGDPVQVIGGFVLLPFWVVGAWALFHSAPTVE